MVALIESLAVVTSGPELIAGSIPTFLNKNGRKSPNVVATIMAENIEMPNAMTIQRCSENWTVSVFEFPIRLDRRLHATAPIIPQVMATTNAIFTSRIKTCPNLSAARWPVARPEITIADV